jgi:hypothetical protein
MRTAIYHKEEEDVINPEFGAISSEKRPKLWGDPFPLHGTDMNLILGICVSGCICLICQLGDCGTNETTNAFDYEAQVQALEREMSTWNLLKPEDINDLPSLLLKLSKPSDPVSLYLHNAFDHSAEQALLAYGSPGADTNEARTFLVSNLNQILRGPLIYDKDRFSNVVLRAETKSHINNFSDGLGNVIVNRELIDDAFPKEIRTSQWLTNLPIFSPTNSPEKRFEDFKTRASNRKTLDDMQLWAVGVLSAAATRSNDVPQIELPKLIYDLEAPSHPNFVTHGPDCVQVDWGGGFGHYGLRIGPTNFNTHSDELLLLVELSPGIYAYHTKY